MELLAFPVALLVPIMMGAVPAALPQPNNPEFWLKRAAAELPAVRRAGRVSLPTAFLEEESLATMLFEARGSDADRDRLVALAKLHEKRAPVEDTPPGRLEPVLTAATLYARGGREADARRLLPAVKAAAGVNEALATNEEVLWLRERLGDLHAEEAAELELINLRVMATMAADDGRADRARAYAALARRAAAPAAEDYGEDQARVVQTSAEVDDFAAAGKVAAAMPKDNHLRVEGFGWIAWAHHRLGDAAARLAALRAGLKAAGEAGPFHRRIGLHELLLDAIDMRDRTAVAEAAAALSAALPDDGDVDPTDAEELSDHVERLTDLAIASEFLGGAARREARDGFCARAEALVGKLPARERAIGWLRVAGARARARDKARAEKAVTRSKEAFDLRETGEESWLHLVTFGYLDAGDLDAAWGSATAMAAADRTLGNWPWEHIGAALARAGRYADAEKAAGTLTVHRLIVVERVKAGKVEGLTRWIDAHDSPHERAMFNLAAAQQMLGLEGKGKLRHLRPREKWRVG